MASLAASLLLAPLAAEAGTCTDTPTAGTTAATITPAADATFNTPSDAVATASASPRSGPATSYTIQISPGTFTDTFTWTHDNAQQDNTTDPPPTCILVAQNSSATWYVQSEGGTGTGSGQADCGLSGGTVASGTYNAPNPSLALSATLYSVKTGLPFSVSCSPTASFTGTTGSAGLVEGEAEVSGGASVSPVTISLGGTQLVSGTQYGLTGRQITATLQGIPTGYTVTKYTWSGPSGTCFKTYNPNISPPANNQLTALASTDLSGTATGGNTVPALAFYDSAAESVTVTCAVTLLAPDTKTSLSLTVTAPSINMEKPTLTQWDIAEGYVQLSSNGSAFGLYGDLSSPDLTNTNGMIWSNVIVNVPAPFSGNGQCTFTQLVNPDHLEYVNGSSTPIGSNNGILGLDGSFEYGTPWNVTGTGNDVDSPNQPLFYRTGLTEISVSDAFTTYVMYQPSGGVWVPLDKFSWTYGMTLNWVPQTQQFTLTASYPKTAGQAPAPTPTTTTDPPQWTVAQASE